MTGHSFLEISCVICSKPLDLSLDLSADEYGKAVHTDCYVNRLIAAHGHQAAVEDFLTFLPVQSPPQFARIGDSSSRMAVLTASFSKSGR